MCYLKKFVKKKINYLEFFSEYFLNDQIIILAGIRELLRNIVF